MSTILLVHTFSCWFLTGVIWMVQVLVYPFFKLVGENEFNRLHQFHMQRISWIVVPIMTLELITAALLYFEKPDSLLLWNLVSVLSLWIFTFLVSVPTHNRLNVHDEASKFNLVARNWPRCILWSGRALFLLWILINSNARILMN
jgi:hypothetical protein